MINYLQNYEAINELVKSHFSLSEKSQEEFTQRLMEGTNAEFEIRKHLDEDFRFEKNLTIEDLEHLDISWKLFKYHFGEYCVDERVTYSEFLLNNRVNQKNSSKLTKDLKRYFLEGNSVFSKRNGQFELNDRLEQINNLRLPRKKLKLVLSFNFSDMFMCSTGQDWTSCLNLESEYSGCYWLGLASIPFDMNRCMIYLAPQKQQEYNKTFGITNERMFRRTFGLLDTENNINILRWYPNDLEGDLYISFLNEALYPFKIKTIGTDFIAKEKVIIPTLKTNNSGNDIGIYIYQDKTILNADKTIEYSRDKGNQYFINKISSEFGSFVHCQGGLKKLIYKDKEINEYTGRRTFCSQCEERIEEEDVCYYNSEPYCIHCYEDIVNEEEDEVAEAII